MSDRKTMLNSTYLLRTESSLWWRDGEYCPLSIEIFISGKVLRVLLNAVLNNNQHIDDALRRRYIRVCYNDIITCSTNVACGTREESYYCARITSDRHWKSFIDCFSSRAFVGVIKLPCDEMFSLNHHWSTKEITYPRRTLVNMTSLLCMKDERNDAVAKIETDPTFRNNTYFKTLQLE